MKKEILPHKHCNLCSNKTTIPNKGLGCKLNLEKPELNTSCWKYVPSNDLEEIIQNTNLEYQVIKNRTLTVYLHLVFYLVVGFAFLISGLLIGKYALNGGVISTVPLIIMGVGIVILPYSVSPYISFRQKLGVSKDEKDELDNILSKYRIEYSVNFNFGKKFHNRQEVSVDLLVKLHATTLAKKHSTLHIYP